MRGRHNDMRFFLELYVERWCVHVYLNAHTTRPLEKLCTVVYSYIRTGSSTTILATRRPEASEIRIYTRIKDFL